jgi:hypothetical protein
VKIINMNALLLLIVLLPLAGLRTMMSRFNVLYVKLVGGSMANIDANNAQPAVMANTLYGLVRDIPIPTADCVIPEAVVLVK